MILHFGNLVGDALSRISVLDDGENSILKPRKRNISVVVQLSGLLPAIELAKILIRFPQGELHEVLSPKWKSLSRLYNHESSI